jgi:hypothetical protein
MSKGPFFNHNPECPMPPPAMPTKAPEGISQEMYNILHNQFNHINGELNTGHRLMADLQGEVSRVHDALEGKDGLITRVAVMESVRKNDAANETKSNNNLWAVLGLVVSVITLLFMAFQVNAGNL